MACEQNSAGHPAKTKPQTMEECGAPSVFQAPPGQNAPKGNMMHSTKRDFILIPTPAPFR